MTRILFFLLLLLFVACTPQGVGDTVSEEMLRQAVTHPQNTICRVLEFYFCDARTDVKCRMTIGPFRLHGIAEEYTCSMLLPPFASSINSLASFYTNGFVDASVAMYRSEIGFFTEYSPCWRLQVTAPSSANVEDVILEINYSYYYDDDRGSGYVKAMQRLPLRAMGATTCRVGRNLSEIILYNSDESVPFSIVCLCYILSKRNFYPL